LNQSANNSYPVCVDAEAARVVGRFLETFSNFEYALKRTEYRTGDNGKNTVKANWDTFGKTLDELRIKIHPDIETMQLIIRPPQRLMLKGTVPEWEPNQLQGLSWENILRHVRNVRNNLVHGEKTILGGEENSAKRIRRSN